MCKVTNSKVSIPLGVHLSGSDPYGENATLELTQAAKPCFITSDKRDRVSIYSRSDRLSTDTITRPPSTDGNRSSGPCARTRARRRDAATRDRRHVPYYRPHETFLPRFRRPEEKYVTGAIVRRHGLRPGGSDYLCSTQTATPVCSVVAD